MSLSIDKQSLDMALTGIKVVEMAGLMPASMCGMILSDFGADVIRIDKPGSPPLDRLGRGKRSIALNLKSPQGLGVLRRQCDKADVLIETFRPGVMEKLSLGPDKLMSSNPRLIYARLTGFGQIGPYSSMPGHEINYVGISGLLSLLGRPEDNPWPPLGMLSGSAGGGLTCALGIVMGLLERARSDRGQVIDASMADGAAYIGSWVFKSRDLPIWKGQRGTNWFDGGLHGYQTYKTKDGKFMAVGALEPQFYEELVQRLKGVGIRHEDIPVQSPEDADEAKKKMAAIFSTKTQKEWQDIFDGTDACVTPVLNLDEAATHPHNTARNSFLPSAVRNQQFGPAPAPRFSRTPATPQTGTSEPVIGEHSISILEQLGYSRQEIEGLIQAKVVHQSQ